MNLFELKIENSPFDKGLVRQVRIMLLLLLGFTAFNYLYNGIIRPLFTDKVDFEAYYNGALAFRHGFPLYQTMVDFFKVGPYAYEGPLPYVYPPFLAIFLSPLAYLDFGTAALIWLLVNHGFFFVGIYFLLWSISPRYSAIEAVTMVFVFMNFTPLFVDYLVGQCNIILFFLITAGLYFYRRERPVYAGVAIAFACVIKVIPLLLLGYILWKRQYKAFLSAVVTLGVLFVYSLLFFDVRLFPWYFKLMIHQTLFNAFHDNHSLTGFFSRLLTDSMWVKGVLDVPMGAKFSILFCSLLLLGLFLYATRKPVQPSDPETLREYALGVITMLLLSKLTSTPYLVMLLLPLGVMTKDLMDRSMNRKWLVALVIAYGILSIWYPLVVGKFLNMTKYGLLLEGWFATLFSLQFLAVLILWSHFYFHQKSGCSLGRPESEIAT